jgi:hypothetical protein
MEAPEIYQPGVSPLRAFRRAESKQKTTDDGSGHVFSLRSASSARFVKANRQHPHHPSDPDLPE